MQVAILKNIETENLKSITKLTITYTFYQCHLYYIDHEKSTCLLKLCFTDMLHGSVMPQGNPHGKLIGLLCGSVVDVSVFDVSFGAVIAFCTMKFQNFRTQVNFAVIYLKFKQSGQIFGYFI